MDEDKFFQTYSKLTKKESSIPGMQMNSPIIKRSKMGSIGLELEVEGRGLRLGEGHFDGLRASKTRAYWVPHEDGSLRNGGREFVLSTPCNVDEVDELLKGLFKVIEANAGVIENTNRCSTHVHINVGGLKINQMTSVIALWYMLEDALINWCGEARKANHFCLALSDCSSTLQAWRNYLQTGKRPQAEGLKYSALNVLPIWKFGSLEFRCGPPAHEPTMPSLWSRFLAAMVEYASETYTNPMDIASAVSENGAVRIFDAICDKAGTPEFRQQVYLVNPDFEYLCMKGLRNAQSILLGFPWQEWIEEINQEYVPNPFSKASKKSLFAPDWVPALDPVVDPGPAPRRPADEPVPEMYASRSRQQRFADLFRAYRINGETRPDATERARRREDEEYRARLRLRGLE